MWCAEPTFTAADFGLTATGVEDVTGATPSMPPPRQHDHEASGSGAQQPTDAWETAAFGTQPPSTYTGDWEFDPWETDPSQGTQYDPLPDSYRRSTGTMQEDMHVDYSDDEEDMHVDLTHNEDPPQPRRRRVQRQKTRTQPPRACGAAPRLSLSGRRPPR
jgi:hypothetical protein